MVASCCIFFPEQCVAVKQRPVAGVIWVSCIPCRHFQGGVSKLARQGKAAEAGGLAVWQAAYNGRASMLLADHFLDML